MKPHWPPLYAQKIGVSLLKLISKIIRPKVVLYFNKISRKCHLTEIWSILNKISPWSLIQLTPFSLLLDLFDPPFWQNLRSDWVHFFTACWTPPPYRKVGEVPPLSKEPWSNEAIVVCIHRPQLVQERQALSKVCTQPSHQPRWTALEQGLSTYNLPIPRSFH